MKKLLLTIISVFACAMMMQAQDYFKETFNNTKGTGGNDSQFSDNIATSSINADVDGWTFANQGGANECVKLGSSKLGSAETPAIDLTTPELADGNSIILSFRAAAWSGDDTNIKVTATGCKLSQTDITIPEAAFGDYRIVITEPTAEVKIKFSALKASKNRFFLDEVRIYQAQISQKPGFMTQPGWFDTESKFVNFDSYAIPAGTKIYYTTDGTTPQVADEYLWNGSGFFIEGNGVKTVRAIAVENGKEPSAELVGEFVLAKYAETLSEMLTFEEGTMARCYEDVNVTYQNGKYLYIRASDGTAAQIYQDVFQSDGVTPKTFNNGDIIYGFYGKVGSYNQCKQITDTDLGKGAYVEEGYQTMAPQRVTANEIAVPAYENRYVKLKKVTISGAQMTDASGAVAFYNTFNIATDWQADTEYSVYGIVNNRNGIAQILPIKVVVETPELKLTEVKMTNILQDRATLNYTVNWTEEFDGATLDLYIDGVNKASTQIKRNNTFVIENLDPATEYNYTVQVKAMNKEDETDETVYASEEKQISFTTTEPLAAPVEGTVLAGEEGYLIFGDWCPEFTFKAETTAESKVKITVTLPSTPVGFMNSVQVIDGTGAMVGILTRAAGSAADVPFSGTCRYAYDKGSEFRFHFAIDSFIDGLPKQTQTRSFVYTVGGDTMTGIQAIEIENLDKAEIYNLNGMRVAADNIPAGIYIVRQGGKTTKMIVK